MGIFKQAIEASKAKKITKQKSILARMFPGARLASMLGNQVRHSYLCFSWLSTGCLQECFGEFYGCASASGGVPDCNGSHTLMNDVHAEQNVDVLRLEQFGMTL